MFEKIASDDFLYTGWPQKRGLLLVVSVFWTVYVAINAFIEPVFSINKSTDYLIISRLVIPALIAVVIFLAWLWARKIPKFDDSEVGIIFAPQLNAEANKVANELFEMLKREIRENQLAKEIRVERLPFTRKISSVQQAISIREMSNCNILIWGNFSSDKKMSGKSVAGFNQLSFTYKQPRLRKNTALSLANDAFLGTVGKSWYIFRDNDFYDLEVLSQNLTEASLNIMGVSFLLGGKYENAIVFLKKVHERLRQFQVVYKDPRNGFRARIRTNLALAYATQALAAYRYEIETKIGRISDVEKKLIESKIMTPHKMAIELDRTNGNYFLMAGTFYFLLEKMDDALEMLELAEVHLPGDGAPNISKAFIALYRGEHEIAVNQYEASLKKVLSEPALIGAIDFIEQLKKYRPLAIYKFATGYMNIVRGDAELGTVDLLSFLAETDDARFKHLRDYSKELLKRYSVN